MESFGTQHRQEIIMIEDKHRQEILQMERLKEKLETEMQAEICSLRNMYEEQKNKVENASENIRTLDKDNRVI